MPPTNNGFNNSTAVKKRSTGGKASDVSDSSEISVFGDEDFQGNSETFQERYCDCLFLF